MRLAKLVLKIVCGILEEVEASIQSAAQTGQDKLLLDDIFDKKSRNGS